MVCQTSNYKVSVIGSRGNRQADTTRRIDFRKCVCFRTLWAAVLPKFALPVPIQAYMIKPGQQRTPQYFQSVLNMMTSSFSDLSFGELAGCVDVTVSVEI